MNFLDTIRHKIENSSIDKFGSIEGTATKTSVLARLEQTRETIEARACEEIHFAQPLLTLNDIGIIYPNSITVIQGQKGVHKSRLTENFCAAFLSANFNREFIGFRVVPLKRFHVVYIDTERNQIDQFPFAIQRIKLRAGLDKTSRSKNLEAVSLIEIERTERFDAISEYLRKVSTKHQNENIIVVLDVVTDCISSFNDAKESLKLIDHINKTINSCNVSFICVIHENPNSFGEGKARGHLGTEIINKATTVISIGFEKGASGKATDLIAVKFLHTRSSKRPEPHYLRYSEQEKGLIVADASFVTEQKNLKAEKAELGELKDWLNENLIGQMSKANLVDKLTGYFDCTSKTVETRLKSLCEGTEPTLLRTKEGKEVFYELKTPF